jgi:hypothetical protein
VTYNAPITAGTYHVIAQERLGNGETGQSSATITVILHKVDISISPSAATIPINSSVDFQATGSSAGKYTVIDWYVEEENSSCTTESVPPQPPSVPCPSGWMWQEEPVQFLPSISATYYSPSTPGTYHVVARALLPTGETGQSVATITVTP